MNILMMTNTFTPHVGGVARSVASFSEAFRKRGHQVLVVAPTFNGSPPDEPGVIRFPAWQHFHHSDFSVPMPVPGRLSLVLRDFAPDIIHSHHPFLLGDTALRIASQRGVPVVFTHHTMYERYTHYLPLDSDRLRRFAMELAAGYCNLCDAVVAPSTTVAEQLRLRGVKVPLRVIPTGVELHRFEAADGRAFRNRLAIPAEALLVGYLGRLSPEKNLGFLTTAVVEFLRERPRACFLLAGEGPTKQEVLQAFAAAGLSDRLYPVGVLDPSTLAEAYRAMNIFVFASRSETQGMVLAEAMAAGTPVVAIDGSGVRDIVRDGENGRLLAEESVAAFVAALHWLAGLPEGERQRIEQGVAQTARKFSMDHSANAMLELYDELIAIGPCQHKSNGPWTAARQRIEEEWKILHNIGQALGEALRTPQTAPTERKRE